MASRKVTLASLAAQISKGFATLTGRIDKIDERMERGFAAVAGDIADVRKEVATKDQNISLHTQVNSIETQLRGMKHDKLETRVADLETEAFGKSRTPQHPAR